jgi:hypothetical protein
MPPLQPGADDFPAYKAIRDEIQHEDNLAGTRLNWFIASQAFLLSALAIAHTSKDQSPPNPHNDFYFPIVPLLAIASCVLILLGIIAGAVAIRRWRRLLNQMIQQNPSLPAIGSDRCIMRLGWSAPLLLPIIFFLAWTCILISGYL